MGYFRFDSNRLLCWRLGPVNSQHQKHYGKLVEVNGLGGHHKPPNGRGMWVFPYPLQDYFLCWHRWECLLPKKYLKKNLPEYPPEGFIDERQKALRDIQKRMKPSLLWANSFYSHIFPDGHSNYNTWYFWESPRSWAKVATGYVGGISVYDGTLYKTKGPGDLLELFVP